MAGRIRFPSIDVDVVLGPTSTEEQRQLELSYS